jgi:hypothetical protein
VIEEMSPIDTKPIVIKDLDIEVTAESLFKKIRTGTNRPDILATAEETLTKVNKIWRPGIVYRWLSVERNQATPGTITIHNSPQTTFDLGHSNRFVEEASQVLVAAYSAGKEVDAETRKASDNQEMLVSFLLDTIALLVLEKTGNIINKLAEEKAAELGWGVSPFLSPGSVHGWELEDQLKLCSLLPLNEINVTITDNAVLSPFKSLSCLIGIGKGYKSTHVGSTCRVCSKNTDCEMKQL